MLTKLHTDEIWATVQSDPVAYKAALETMKKGDMVVVFTPGYFLFYLFFQSSISTERFALIIMNLLDDTHYNITKEAIQKGLHILITKPAVKLLK